MRRFPPVTGRRLRAARRRRLEFDSLEVRLAPAVAISIGDATVTEGNSGTVNATFTVSLSGSSSKKITVDFATSDGTATAGADYVAKSGTVTFNHGQTSQTVTIA